MERAGPAAGEHAPMGDGAVGKRCRWCCPCAPQGVSLRRRPRPMVCADDYMGAMSAGAHPQRRMPKFDHVLNRNPRIGRPHRSGRQHRLDGLPIASATSEEIALLRAEREPTNLWPTCSTRSASHQPGKEPAANCLRQRHIAACCCRPASQEKVRYLCLTLAAARLETAAPRLACGDSAGARRIEADGPPSASDWRRVGGARRSATGLRPVPLRRRPALTNQDCEFERPRGVPKVEPRHPHSLGRPTTSLSLSARSHLTVNLVSTTSSGVPPDTSLPAVVRGAATPGFRHTRERMLDVRCSEVPGRTVSLPGRHEIPTNLPRPRTSKTVPPAPTRYDSPADATLPHHILTAMTNSQTALVRCACRLACRLWSVAAISQRGGSTDREQVPGFSGAGTRLESPSESMRSAYSGGSKDTPTIAQVTAVGTGPSRRGQCLRDDRSAISPAAGVLAQRRSPMVRQFVTGASTRRSSPAHTHRAGPRQPRSSGRNGPRKHAITGADPTAQQFLARPRLYRIRPPKTIKSTITRCNGCDHGQSSGLKSSNFVPEAEQSRRLPG